jgi:hypothetical protein
MSTAVEEALIELCQALSEQPELIDSYICYHLWPELAWYPTLFKRTWYDTLIGGAAAVLKRLTSEARRAKRAD